MATYKEGKISKFRLFHKITAVLNDLVDYFMFFGNKFQSS